jgi:hypothetical protein
MGRPITDWRAPGVTTRQFAELGRGIADDPPHRCGGQWLFDPVLVINRLASLEASAHKKPPDDFERETVRREKRDRHVRFNEAGCSD